MPSVSQRTTPSPRWRKGSKSNVMTAGRHDGQSSEPTGRRPGGRRRGEATSRRAPMPVHGSRVNWPTLRVSGTRSPGSLTRDEHRPIGRRSGAATDDMPRGRVGGPPLGWSKDSGDFDRPPIRTSGPWGDGPDVRSAAGDTDEMNNMHANAPTLSVRLLGRLEIVACGQPIRLAGRHAQALAALLAIRPRPRLRDTIAAELWPDFDGPSASSLRQALWLLRTGFSAAGVEPDAVLDVGQDTLGLRPELELDTDVVCVRGARRRRPGRRRSPRSTCTGATSPRASGTSASPPTASGSRTCTRTPSSASPRRAWMPATWPAPARPRRRRSPAIRSARRRTRSSSPRTDRPGRAPRSCASTVACARSSGRSSR